MNYANFTVNITFNASANMWNVLVIKPNGLTVSSQIFGGVEEAMETAKKWISNSFEENKKTDGRYW